MEANSIKRILDDKLNYQNRNTRNALAEVFKDKVFTPVYDISLRNHKELAFERLKKVMESKPCSVKDFLTDPNNIFTMHEMVLIFFFYIYDTVEYFIYLVSLNFF